MSSSVNKSTVSPQCKAFVHLLLERSNDSAKPVYGLQTGLAKLLCRTTRMVQIYCKQAEEAGLITVTRFDPERQHDGSWRRPHTNIYVFCVPPGSPNRKPKQPKDRSLYIGETGFTKNHSLKGVSKTFRKEKHEYRLMWGPDDPEPFKNKPTISFNQMRANATRAGGSADVR